MTQEHNDKELYSSDSLLTPTPNKEKGREKYQDGIYKKFED